MTVSSVLADGGELEFGVASGLLADYLANPAQFPDPYPIFRAVRATEPVHWSEAGIWLVLGHPEGRDAYRHEGLSRREFTKGFIARFDDSTEAARDALEVWLSNFINMDDPEHAQVRSLVSQAFTPRAIRQWESAIVQGVQELVAELQEQDEFDLLHDFAYRLPSQVTADMVGVPRTDHKLFEEWTSSWLNTNVTDQRADLMKASVGPLEEFVAYLRALLNERRAALPAKSDDLITMLLCAEDSGVKLTERQVIAAVMLLIIAGHETTANLISNGFLALLRNPDQLAKLKAQPDLISSAVEEFLRYESPARSQPRLAIADIPIGDVVIRKGQPIQVHVGAVNHDGRIFDRPDAMDITRSNNSHHLGFGAGAHFCLGLHVARLETRHAITALVRDMSLEQTGDVTWRNGHVRGVTSFPVRRV